MAARQRAAPGKTPGSGLCASSTPTSGDAAGLAFACAAARALRPDEPRGERIGP